MDIQQQSVKVAFKDVSGSDFYGKLKKSHVLYLDGFDLKDLVGVNYVVIFESRTPCLVAEVHEVLLPKAVNMPVTVRVGKVRYFGDSWMEYINLFPDESGRRRRVIGFENDVFSRLDAEFQLCTRLMDYGALSMREAIERVAASYSVKPSQVKISIAEIGKDSD